MSGLPRPGALPSKRMPSSRPGSMRPPPNPMRGRSATPSQSGRTSPTGSVVSVRTDGGVKRKQRDFEHGDQETNINVVVRCRGRNDREVRENSGVVVRTDGIKGKTVDLSMGPSALSNKTYQFDKVFSSSADQTMVFEEVVVPIMDEVMSGFNCTIFAYGQTGTGKTYTMSGDISDMLPLPDDAGIVPRVLYSLFDRLEAEECENSVKCSFIELYNEELRDLISADDSVKLKIFDDNNRKGGSSTMVQGMEECHLRTASQGIQLLRQGSHKRQVAATKCNDLSSRSHTVFTITVFMKRQGDDGQEYMSAGKLNLVDLAGSENIQRSGAENKRAAEAGLINKSLLTLGRVINALVEKSAHVPYRESKLTRLLQDSLGGQTKTCIIATLSPAKSNLEETISTLDYAFRAKNIRNKPQVNQAISKKTLLREFTVEIEKLKSELIATRQRNGVYLTQDAYEEFKTESESLKILSDEQREKLETMEINLRNKVQDLYTLTNNFNSLKKDNEQVKLTLEGTKGILEKTEVVLEHTRQNLTEETTLRKAHQKTEAELAQVGQDMISTLSKTTSDIDGLRSKIRRKSDIQSQNRQNWASSRTHVIDTTRLVEDRIEQLYHQQQHLMSGLAATMQRFVKDELDQLGSSQSFLGEKLELFDTSEKEVNEQTARARDDMNQVLGEIINLREDVKLNVGEGLNELSAAAEKISASIITELDAFHTQLHSSYAALGRDFKNTFDELTKGLNEQQVENDRLHQHMKEANAALIESNKLTRHRLVELVDDEKQKAAEERQQLLSQITSLLSSTADAQEKRLTDRVSRLREDLEMADMAYESEQMTYNEGMSAWTSKSKEILVGVTRSRDAVKTKLKADFAAATEHSTSIKETTTSVHASTIKTVEAQMAHMDTQLHSLDDIVTRTRAQNDSHHKAHTTSLGALSSTVLSSYSSIGDHLSASFARVQTLESEVLAQATALQETLPSLAEAATIRAPLEELRNEIFNRKLVEYNPTGETPQRVNYLVPTDLPRTESHETLLSRLRDRPASSDSTSSPTKCLVFNDATNSTSPPDDLFSLPLAKPTFSRSVMPTHEGTGMPSVPPPSLRELDINIVPQAANQDAASSCQPVSPSAVHSSSNCSELPPMKKHNRGNGGGADGESKLPMKKMARKTVAGLGDGKGDRENLSITSFSSSIGPGTMGGRRLRSHGST
ncbi:kinesin family protein-like protein [Aaosphaeria arxii CBS 175.79]|uniref:Kinesin family protein-like protein n=1 Tax=Aaosphaeria arxii CBS 175.79 TaxID=1450172 RepID=A0A6A5X9B3_9PLEO|nr:kinesin family protein-like protein [Aaosphaeria arxii CBS 175.79]KAF2009334.1 kinesin family protein-like protein [Aaosphaeria arxii CBS 175.79]